MTLERQRRKKLRLTEDSRATLKHYDPDSQKERSVEEGDLAEKSECLVSMTTEKGERKIPAHVWNETAGNIEFRKSAPGGILIFSPCTVVF